MSPDLTGSRPVRFVGAIGRQPQLRSAHWPHAHRAARTGLGRSAGALRVPHPWSHWRDCGRGFRRRSTSPAAEAGTDDPRVPASARIRRRTLRSRKGGRPRSKDSVSRLPLAARLCQWAEDHLPSGRTEILTKSAGLSSKITLGEGMKPLGDFCLTRIAGSGARSIARDAASSREATFQSTRAAGKAKTRPHPGGRALATERAHLVGTRR
jgi:hypothetical protein